MSWDGNFEACEVDISLRNIYWGVFEGRKSNRCCLFDTEISIELSTMLSHSAIFVYVPGVLRMRQKLVLFVFRCKFIHSSVGCRSWVNAHAFIDVVASLVAHGWCEKQRNKKTFSKPTFYPQMCLISINLLNESIALKFHFTWARTRFCNFFISLPSSSQIDFEYF